MKTYNTDLLDNIITVHTTKMGLVRICKNLNLNKKDIVEWCKQQIIHPSSKISRKGKNWYISINNCIFTVNAHSYTIITAHKEKQ